MVINELKGGMQRVKIRSEQRVKNICCTEVMCIELKICSVRRVKFSVCKGLNICVALIRVEQRRLEERLRQLREEEERLVKETADEQQLQRTADEVSGGEKMRKRERYCYWCSF